MNMFETLASRGGVILVAIILIGLTVFVALSTGHLFAVMARNLFEDICRHIRKGKKSKGLSRKFRSLISKNPHDFVVDVLFETFIDFYEKNFHRESSWELDRTAFPEGINELTTRYLWIKNTRASNRKLADEIVFDLESGCILIYGHLYPDFETKFDKYGILHVTPLPYEESIGFLKYKLKAEKLHEQIVTMDNEMCDWIIKNRRYFAF